MKIASIKSPALSKLWAGKIFLSMRLTLYALLLAVVHSYALSGYVQATEMTLTSVFEQQQTVSGTVTNQAGESLPGATVMIKETTLGTVTDTDGEYTISNVPPDGTLVFSFIGMRTQEVGIDGRTVINVVMEPDAIGLEEVVAIGYGTARRADVSGAVGTVGGAELAERRSTQLSQALQGAMPGLMVTRNHGRPGFGATLRIRGITTIGDSSPLIIVDGIPVSNINDVNANDVENISILKDAASASIYGSRAAAGVILITTKRAAPGDLTLSFNSEYGVERPTRLASQVGPVRYMEIFNERIWNDNDNRDSEYPIYSRDLIENYYDLNAQNPDLYPITDMIDLIINDYAPRQTHNLNIAGGTETVRSNFSLSYDQVDALYDYETYERISARLNNDITINEYLSATLDMHVVRPMRKLPSMDPLHNMYSSAPIYAAQWSDGRVGAGKDGANIYGQLHYGGFQEQSNIRTGGRISINFTPIKDLTLTAVISPEWDTYRGKNFQKKVPYYAWDDPTNYQGELEWARTTDLYETRNSDQTVTGQLLANYNTSFAGHSINLLGGFEEYYAFYERLSASREQFDLTGFPYLNIGPLTYRDNSGSAWENAYRSFFGRVMYNYESRYFLQANLRYDGSSRFHSDYRWGAYPSVSAAWTVSEEIFMQNAAWLPYLKVRGSWGTLGNERIGTYPYQATIGFSNALFHRGTNVVSDQTAGQTRFPIPNISWETTETYNIGVDFGFLDNRFLLTADYYEKKTKDMLLSLEIPNFLGFPNPSQNAGDMSTTGWELELNYRDAAGEFIYSFSANISDSRTLMGNLAGTEFIGDQVIKEGSEFNEWYGYRTDGLFQTAEEVAASPRLHDNVRPGDVKYLDVDGPDGVPDGVVSPEHDRVFLGGSLPRYIYGGNLRLGYRGLDFLMVVQGVGKQNNRLQGHMVAPTHWGGVPAIIDGNYWSVYNTPEENQNVFFPRRTEIGRYDKHLMSDYWMISGAYFRLKNITLGYTLPESITQSIRIQNIRIYGSMTDVFTIDSYPTGWDPEVAHNGHPITTSILFGISVNF